MIIFQTTSSNLQFVVVKHASPMKYRLKSRFMDGISYIYDISNNGSLHNGINHPAAKLLSTPDLIVAGKLYNKIVFQEFNLERQLCLNMQLVNVNYNDYCNNEFY